MTLTDTGPLVALVNAKDRSYARVVAALATLRGPMLTTWPWFAEAMYLAHRFGGHAAQDELWDYIADGSLVLHASSAAELERMQILMRQYRDTPMDLADASLVAAAETLGATRIFTLDSVFYVYRLNNGTALQVVP